MQEFVSFAENLIKSSNEVPTGSKIKADDAINFDTDSPSHLKNVGTANSRTISSSTGTSTSQKKTTNPARKSYRPDSRNAKKSINSNDRPKDRVKRAETRPKKPENLTDPSFVPIDLSNYSKPSKLDIVLPEYIVDHVESFSVQQGEKQTINSPEIVSEAIKAEENRATEHKVMEGAVQKVVEVMKSLEESYKFLYDQIESAKKVFPVNDPTQKELDEVLANASPPPTTIPDIS